MCKAKSPVETGRRCFNKLQECLLKAINMARELGYYNAFSLTKRWEHSTYGV
jgi:hypothetical protein